MNVSLVVDLSDQAAFLIGQLIMSWGRFDQRLYAQIIQLESIKYMRNPVGDAPTIEEIIDYRFEARVKRLRKLCLELSLGEHLIMARVDQVIRKLNELSLIRHHVVHGYIRVLLSPGDGPILQIIEHREKWKQQKAVTKKILTQRYKPKANDFGTSYTFDQIREAKSKTDQLYNEFSEVFANVVRK